MPLTAAEILRDRFVLRDDVYPVQQRSGAYLPVHEPFTLDVLRDHLRGQHCVGAYPLNGAVTKWICLDVDGENENPENAREAVGALRDTCRHFSLLPYIERSGGKGWHLWIFATGEVQGSIARAVGRGLVAEAGDERLFGTSEVAVFPKQSSVDLSDPTNLGNLVKLPWGKRADNGARGVFVHTETLSPLRQSAQQDLLEGAVRYSEEELRTLVEENGWTVAESLPVVESNGTFRRSNNGTYKGDLPCYEALADVDGVLSIPEGHRNSVLFAFTSQLKRKGSSEKVALREILSLSRDKCASGVKPIAESEVRKIVTSCYKSDSSSANCDIIQTAKLCPALLYGVVCPIFKRSEEKRVERKEALEKDETRLTIQPLRVSRGNPPIYTATVKGKDLRLSLKELVNFSFFKERCISELDFVPQLPVITYTFIDDNGNKKTKARTVGFVWDEIVNEALASVIEEDAPPEDASAAGATWDCICEYLGEHKISEDRDRLLKGGVVTEGGDYIFRGKALRRYLKLQGVDQLSEHQLWMLVRDRGGQNGPIRTTRGLVRVWRVPSSSVETMGDPVTEAGGYDLENSGFKA